MRNLLIVALLLYNFVAFATRPAFYDYEDMDGSKRNSLIDDRRNWRKKALSKPIDEHKDWDRWSHTYDNHRYIDDQELKGFNGIERQRDRERDIDMPSSYRGGINQHYDNDNNMQHSLKSAERDGHSVPYMEKESEKKTLMNCNRPHERFEACFAGCASVTCDNPRERLRPCYPFCEPGCICIHPYIRDDRTHKCVLPEECTKGLKGIPDLGEDI